MSKLTWDPAGERYYETGVNECALYVKENGAYGTGVAWNGITAINENPSGAEPTALYANNHKYLTLLSKEEYAATIEAYTYPDAFAKCDGSAELISGLAGAYVRQQPRSTFGLVYKTNIGNDEDGDSAHYTLHIVYECLAAPSAKSHNTINESPEATTMSWEVSTNPIEMPDPLQNSATIEFDSRKFTGTNAANFTKLQEYLYGSETLQPQLLTPAQIVTVLTTGKLE